MKLLNLWPCDLNFQEDQEVWTQRPAPLHILTTAMKQVKHLLPLRVKLMENLLKEVTVGTEIYLGYVRDSSNEDSKRGLVSRRFGDELPIIVEPSSVIRDLPKQGSKQAN